VLVVQRSCGSSAGSEPNVPNSPKTEAMAEARSILSASLLDEPLELVLEGWPLPWLKVSDALHFLTLGRGRWPTASFLSSLPSLMILADSP
jgi:hypothetical protein